MRPYNTILISFLISLLLLSCIQNIPEFTGHWAVHVVEYKDEDIANLKNLGGYTLANDMFVNSRPNSIFFPVDSAENHGRYKVISLKDNLIEIYNATDSRFNGTFKVEINELSSTATSKQFQIVLSNQDWYIEGQKSVAYL
jgi:hypothetical protein